MESNRSSLYLFTGVVVLTFLLAVVLTAVYVSISPGGAVPANVSQASNETGGAATAGGGGETQVAAASQAGQDADSDMAQGSGNGSGSGQADAAGGDTPGRRVACTHWCRRRTGRRRLAGWSAWPGPRS